MGTLSYLFGSAKPVYATIDAPVASDLTWEVVEQYNVGVDAAFLNNRLTASVEGYIRDTKGMLTKGVTLPGVYGTSSPKMNAADMRTKGYELTLSWRDQFMLAGKPFGYSASLVFSDYTTKITRFDNPQKLLSDYYEGQTYGEIWGYVTDGFFKSDAEAKEYQGLVDQTAVNGIIFAAAGEENGLRAGDLKYVDLPTIDTDGDGIPDKGDGKISQGQNTLANPGDRRVIGNSQPRYQYGINLGANWMGFDLAIFLQGVGKADWYPDPDARTFWDAAEGGALHGQTLADGHGEGIHADTHGQQREFSKTHKKFLQACCLARRGNGEPSLRMQVSSIKTRQRKPQDVDVSRPHAATTPLTTPILTNFRGDVNREKQCFTTWIKKFTIYTCFGK